MDKDGKVPQDGTLKVATTGELKGEVAVGTRTFNVPTVYVSFRIVLDGTQERVGGYERPAEDKESFSN